ncbi:MAG: Fe-S oxidoreductase [Candidatus Thiodiazotropha sp. (ex Lucinoma aequizonata)]|nr:Fe-S oxidoreductase [Candidatus Thiodiazotropha sp. (ex Lucinoma aequizonata)]MCU7888518.1 Fe-S oxidoreductase [Candidatus Thiodiazotropha sp. (ex Lucinoma aequizonata)]MCU7894483.1 Fe-S oxidoreductase [Candidatus Thiodiazotropha sp. (ex Lucinoma aequizonata)]MCU7898087.1 Fe-S oxidoreductase [Candidatus Thiodiazotropha sp. (ex Lucinoma aequizonata)]MCU7900680.1 Fe-S oxidoreductase [Candidatus Thiodiazotropha sp. (ex Lucinoma aequizonata)]
MAAPTGQREGNLEAPTRHPIDWKNPDYYNEEKLMAELDRVFDLCHGCRRCVSLCKSFPTLFDLVDESETMEVDGVDEKDYWQVVDHCYLCDLCFMTKCPYVPPHNWNIDFPHLMLRGKAVKYQKGDVKLRDRLLTSTDNLGKLAGIPIIAGVVNRFNMTKNFREILDHSLGVHPEAKLPEFHSKPLRKRLADRKNRTVEGTSAGTTNGKVALFSTCYGNYNEPHLGEDLLAVFEHNDIPVTIAEKEQCCGMPKLELGNLEAVEAAKNANIPVLAKLVDDGWDIVAPVPSCALMFKQELPLLFPDDPAVKKVSKAIFDIFEYLIIRHKEGLLKTDFKQGLGKVAYHAACHQRVQNVGAKTKELLTLLPDTHVTVIERCSGHDGTYAIKSEFHQHAMKIGKPVVNKVKQADADHYGSDCPMAGQHIENGLRNGRQPEHPISLVRKAYGI